MGSLITCAYSLESVSGLNSQACSLLAFGHSSLRNWGNAFPSFKKSRNGVLPITSLVVTTVMYRDGHNIVKSIPLHNNSVARRTDDMANAVENTLCGMCL